MEPLTFEDYMSRCVIDEDHPGLLFLWDPEALKIFADAANRIEVLTQPQWVTTPPGMMTDISFQEDVINRLALAGGGAFGRVLIAPNDLAQFGNVITLAGQMELHPFVQAAMQAVPKIACLAYTAIVTDRENIAGTPARRIAPDASLGLRQGLVQVVGSQTGHSEQDRRVNAVG
ncbi:hypothetical protein R1sor_016312 [Riccia sorocarpa]|uniref:Uncharacterized protein n=1 Tax=Riccia sorocarpa TaxID=122646 RepID=A0ABD3HEL6_9MARC